MSSTSLSAMDDCKLGVEHKQIVPSRLCCRHDATTPHAGGMGADDYSGGSIVSRRYLHVPTWVLYAICCVYKLHMYVYTSPSTYVIMDLVPTHLHFVPSWADDPRSTNLFCRPLYIRSMYVHHVLHRPPLHYLHGPRTTTVSRHFVDRISVLLASLQQGVRVRTDMTMVLPPLCGPSAGCIPVITQRSWPWLVGQSSQIQTTPGQLGL